MRPALRRYREASGCRPLAAFFAIKSPAHSLGSARPPFAAIDLAPKDAFGKCYWRDVFSARPSPPRDDFYPSSEPPPAVGLDPGLDPGGHAETGAEASGPAAHCGD